MRSPPTEAAELRTSPVRLLFLWLVAKPLAAFFAGADVIGREHLPKAGPAILAANHNSHVDTLLLLAIFPAKTVGRVRPVAAADYFLTNPVMSWFSRRLVGIAPVSRAPTRGEDVLGPAKAALAEGSILVLFPEGTRGAASDEMGPLKTGVARLVEAFPTAPVTPVWIQGAGRVLPKGAVAPVPMNCCVLVGEPIAWNGDRAAFMAELKAGLEALKAKAPPLKWS